MKEGSLKRAFTAQKKKLEKQQQKLFKCRKALAVARKKAQNSRVLNEKLQKKYRSVSQRSSKKYQAWAWHSLMRIKKLVCIRPAAFRRVRIGTLKTGVRIRCREPRKTAFYGCFFSFLWKCYSARGSVRCRVEILGRCDCSPGVHGVCAFHSHRKLPQIYKTSLTASKTGFFQWMTMPDTFPVFAD